MVGFGDPHEAYHAGKMAYVAGVPLGACPYTDRHSGDYRQWRGGWLEMNRNDPLLDDDEHTATPPDGSE